MKSKLIKLSLVLMMIISLVIPSSLVLAQDPNGAETKNIGNPLYPGTQIEMQVGDVLYSHKLSFSTAIVGHVGIVGEDFKVYHVNPHSPYGHSDTISRYLGRHSLGEKITVMRQPFSGRAVNAARWAKNNIDEVSSYSLNHSLSNISKNYCSKFIWQAFWYGAGIDIIEKGLTGNSSSFVTPGQIYNKMNVSTYFNVR